MHFIICANCGFTAFCLTRNIRGFRKLESENKLIFFNLTDKDLMH